jgi:membrane associated rhomboid family serine protease
MIENQTVRLQYLLRFVTYPFLQGSFTQAVFVVVFILALGKMVAERMGQWNVLIIFMGASIIGALVYGIVWDTRVPLFGGYPGAYSLIGAFTLILYTRLGETGGRQIQAFALIGALLAIQFIFGVFFGAGTGWVAEVAGFVSGFFLAALLFPGAWDKIVARIRRRA